MIDAKFFDTEYVVLGKNFAKSVGLVSERELNSFFKILEGRKSIDWSYTCNGVRVEWSDRYDVIEHNRSHTFFSVMPVAPDSHFRRVLNLDGNMVSFASTI